MEDLQRRAVALAMQYPGVLDGSLEDSWDELWLRLGEELGWEAIGRLDAGVLRDEVGWAVESERLRRAGVFDVRFEQLNTAAAWEDFAARCRLPPGEVFGLPHWLGPLLTEDARERLERRQKDWEGHSASYRERGVREREPGFHVNVFCDFDRRWIQDVSALSVDELEAALLALGAPEICRDVHLGFGPGARVPLRLAVEIVLADEGGQDLIFVCLPGRLGYVGTHERGFCIVHRPS
jgi:hypothetical protein